MKLGETMLIGAVAGTVVLALAGWIIPAGLCFGLGTLLAFAAAVACKN